MAFDVFLSHNSRDKPAVRDLKAALEAYGLKAWLDADELVPGENWQPGLEQGIRGSLSAAVCFGPAGIGPWEDEESQALLTQAVRDRKRVIPVLLPGAPEEPPIPIFLRNRTWVDLRPAITDANLDRLVWGVTGRKPERRPVIRDTEVDVARLAKYAPRDLFGRESERAELDAALADPKIGVYSLIAFGGVGKTALAAHWLAGLAARDWPGLERVFGWSFYSQGTKEDGAASSDSFFAAAFGFFGETDPALAQLSPWDRGARLARCVAKAPGLLVLDGLEPMQQPPGPLEGRLKDQAIEALLTTLASGKHPGGLCLLTSREPVRELEGLPTAKDRRLDFLSEPAGAALLHSRGVNRAGAVAIAPDDAELRQASRAVGGHALTLHILGLYLAKAHGGDVRQRDTVDLEDADVQYKTNPADRNQPYGHAYKVMAAYDRWLEQGGKQGRRQLAVLRLLGLFDRPADPGCLAALRAEPAIPGLTEPLAGLGTAEWNLLIADLQAAGLVQTAEYAPPVLRGYGEEIARKALEAYARNVDYPLGEPQPFPSHHSPLTTSHSLDSHPLLREHCARRLREDRPDAWREGQRRLFEHLKNAVPYWPEGEAGLQPLYQAVAHGCRAGLYEAACTEVYRDRILRRGEAYSTKKLGLIGADLGAVACFFDPPWTRPVPDLSEAARAWLLAVAAFDLRALGRLGEALEPMRAGMEMGVAAEDWKEAAIRANNLSELEATLGRLAAAVADGGRAVDHADRSGEWSMRMIMRTTLADALQLAGRRGESLDRFREAEAIQAEWQPAAPLLYSLPGFRYCDALLAEAERAAWRRCFPLLAGEGRVRGSKGDFVPSTLGDMEGGEQGEDGKLLLDAPHPNPLPEGEGVAAACRAVAERAARTLPIAEENNWLLAIALDHLTLARAALYAALLADEAAELAAARRHATAAVDGLRASGNQDDIPRGLLTRAWLSEVEARQGLEPATPAADDLDLAERIAGRGGMKLHLADIHLHRARLFGDREALAQARALIDECGYERRRGEWEDAEQAMA